MLKQKNYKDIALIILRQKDTYRKDDNFLRKEIDEISNSLADYFEKEAKRMIAKYFKNGKIKKILGYGGEVFNREQFLRQCGVRK